MIALEKLLLLQSVVLFKQTPVELLSHLVATIVKEKTISAGQTIIEKGQINSTMYVIVSGKLKVHEGKHTVSNLGERDIFGELSALTGAPTVATVTAITDALLLSISSDALYELMDHDPGLSRGIIQALCMRTQALSLQIQGLFEETQI